MRGDPFAVGILEEIFTRVGGRIGIGRVEMLWLKRLRRRGLPKSR